ncbi:efflux RND transporter periplasmic adaptor subunit [bacterium]|nr:efflux RND transporter periplasmic adaptor subunit [bacterium]
MKKKINTKKTIIIIFAIIILISILFFYQKIEAETEKKEIIEKKYNVETILVSPEKNIDLYIETVASVHPETKVSVVSLSNGTIKNLPFNIGDKVENGQILAYLNSNLIQTGFLNAETNYYNLLNNLETVRQSSEENVKQSEINLEKAQEALNNAKTTLETTKKNYEKSIELQKQSLNNNENNAISSFSSYLLTIKDTLEEINYIIHAEEGDQFPGISKTLSAKNISALNTAKNNYLKTKHNYENVKKIEINNNNLENNLNLIISLLKETKEVTDNTITVLDNTVTSRDLTQSILNGQREKFSLLYSQTIASIQSAESILSSLKSLKISQEKELINLENSLITAKNQVSMAELSYNNSLTSVNSAKQAKQQQILSAQIQVDNALGQLNLNQEQISDLLIKAPISGQISSKTAEIGTELSPGQKIAEISKTDIVKIKASLSAEDISSIAIGQKVLINEEIEATINTISPGADPITKKVEIEIVVENKENKFIPGTFVNIKINKNPISLIKNGVTKVPLEAIQITQTENYVFLAIKNENDTEYIAKKQIVTIGDSEKNLINITSGIKDGDKIIVSGSKMLKDGDKINIIK